MRRSKRFFGLLLAILLFVGIMPSPAGPAHAALEDQFKYPKVTYSAAGGMTSNIITMSGTKYLVYTFTKSGTVTVNGTYPADLWLAGGGADGQNLYESNTSNIGYGGGGGYTTNVFDLILRSGNITIGPGSGGTTSFVYPDPSNPGYNKTVSAAGGNGPNGGSGGGSFTGGVGQGRSTRPFAAAEMPAYCQGGGSQDWWLESLSGGHGGLLGGSDGSNGGYIKTTYPAGAMAPTNTSGIGGGAPATFNWGQNPGNNATNFGGGGGGGRPAGKGYQGAMMIRIPLTSLLPADYASVDAAIAWANSLPKQNYKDFTPVTNAINAVDRTKVVSEQAEVHAMAAAITAAVNSLESTGADYSMVDQLYAHALSLKSSDYEDFSGVIAALSSIDRNKTVQQQAEVNTMAKNIFVAINALKPLPADYTAVDAALAAIDRLPDPSYYVTMEPLIAAKSIVVRGKLKPQQADVDAMYKTLINAIDSLQLLPADYSTVDNTILYAAQMNASYYKNFDNVIDAARSVDRSKTILEQVEVDMMAASLLSAIDDLEYIEADYSGVDTAVRYVQGLVPSNYSNFEPLSAAVRAVDRTKTIQEQAQVDKMAEDIVQAILTLQRIEPVVTPTPTPTPTPDTEPTPTPTVPTNVPSMPQNFTAKSGDSQITLNWTAPTSNGDSSIIKYQVSKDNGTTWSDVGLSTSYTFSGLTNTVVYTFKVRAVNSAGNGAQALAIAAPISYTNPNQSNGVTLEQLQALLEKNKTQTVSSSTIRPPKTGEQISRWGILLIMLAAPATALYMRRKRGK